MRVAALLLALAGAAAAEVARRDLQLAVGAADPDFAYTLDAPVARFAGEDAFDRVVEVRPGGRWAIARPGSAWAPLLGADLTILDAGLPGGGMRAYGLAAAAGLTWAPAGRHSLDAEAWFGRARASLDLDTADGGRLSGAGDQDGLGMRLRWLWSPSRHWSWGIEAGWQRRTATIAGDAGRSLRLDAAGFAGGLVLAWRPSARPAGLE